MSKSYVSLEKKACPVCGRKHAVGFLLDRRLKNSLESETVTGYDMCETCGEQINNGYLALICVKNDGEGQTLKMEEADRTGELAFIPREIATEIFNMPLKDDQNIVFIDEMALQNLKDMVVRES